MATPSTFQQMCRFAGKQEILSKDAERTLIKYYQDELCAISLKKLINAHFKFIIKIAGQSKYGRTHDEKAENIQNAILGFQKAIEKFDLNRETRLSTYATSRIIDGVLKGIDKQRSIVHTPVSKQFRDAYRHGDKETAKARQQNPYLTDGESMAIASKKLGVSDQVMQRVTLKKMGVMSLNVKGSYDQGEKERIDLIESEALPTEDTIAHKHDLEFKSGKLIEAFSSVLNAREQDIIFRRKLKEQPDTLEVLPQDHKVSKERIRQLEVRAFEKLQNVFVI